MRLTLLIAIVLFSFISSNAQYGDILYCDTIDFEQSSSRIVIDTLNLNNIWQIGVPAKPFFDSSYSFSNAIVTDLINPYPINDSSFFDLNIDDEMEEWYMWGEGLLSFWHKYETDTLQDGGYLEVSYDGGISWLNIIDDINHIDAHADGFYSHNDTINGGIPAFSGNSGGWVYSEYYWWWVALVNDWPDDSLIVRFNFKSDSINTYKAGWMIDDIRFNGYEVSGAIDENISHNSLSVYPNPVSDYFIINFKNDDEYLFELFDCTGRLLLSRHNITENSFRIGGLDLSSGIYPFILKGNNNVYSGKILVN